jgi:hypothetical protein
MTIKFLKEAKQMSIKATVLGLLAFGLVLTGCEKKLPDSLKPPVGGPIDPPVYEHPNIDLANWKVTLPIPRADGKPIEVEPPEILDYTTNETLKPFMYDDTLDGSLVFYTYPGSTTTNTSYSRTELREQMVPGSNNTNWTFAEGGKMKGTLSVPEISKKSNGDYHRTIIMQIHGRLTNAQKALINASDNNAPPVLKIYWQDNKVYVRTKQLKNVNATYEEMLETDAWEDDEGKFFSRIVETDSFTLEVVAEQGKLSVILDDDETFVYDDIHMEKWGVFENYFKAGNYLGTTDVGSFSRVKYYNLEVNHD